jgi:hypothetical protein
VKVEHSYDKILVYSIQESGAFGTSVLQATLTGSISGTLYSLSTTGKMRIEFTTDQSVNCSTNPNYSGFQIDIVDELAQVVNVTEQGFIGVSCSEYTNNLTKIWKVDVPFKNRLNVHYSVNTETNYDKIKVYSINDANVAVLQTTLTGSTSGAFYPLYSTGKMWIEFTTDNSVNCSTNPNYSGFQMSIGEPELQYSYDASGNRTDRRVEFASFTQAGEQEEEEEIIYIEKLSYSGGIEKPEADIRIYPNPTRGQFAVEIGSFSGITTGEVSLTDANGKILDKKEISTGKLNFDISRELPGIYLINIRLGEKISTWKIIKQ